MKNRKWRYIIATFIAALLVTCSVLMPSVLLSKTEDSILNAPYTVSDGISSSSQADSNVTGISATQAVTSVQQLAQSALLFGQGATTSVLANEQLSGSMDINQAVSSCIKQTNDLLLKKALPPLTGFPQAYAVFAELRTLTDKPSHQTLQYWNIGFTDRATDDTKFSVALDAQTGRFLSIALVYSSMSGMVSQIDLVHSTNVIAQSMNIPGKLLSVDQIDVPSTARWQFDNSSLIMQVTLEQKDLYTIFNMTLSTK